MTKFPTSTEGDSSAEEDIAATRRYVGEDAEVVGGGPEHGHFTGVRPNREQRRKSLKNKDEILTVDSIIVVFDNSEQVKLDPSKVMIVDKETGAKLFREVLEAK